MSDDFRGAGGQFQVELLNGGVNVRRKSTSFKSAFKSLRELQCNVSESSEFQTEGAQHRKVGSGKCVLVVGL